MISSTRACIAYIAGCSIGGVDANAIYDYSQSEFLFIKGTIDKSNAKVYDFRRSCFVAGNATDNSRYNLYDYGTSAFVQLAIKTGGQFDGYDFNTSSFFSGLVRGRIVSLYDFQDSTWYQYSL